MGAADKGVEQGGCGCPYLGSYLLGGGIVGHYIRVRDVNHDSPHWEGVGQIPQQGIPQDDGESNLERKGWFMVITPDVGRDGGCMTEGGGDLRLPPPEHIRTVY